VLSFFLILIVKGGEKQMRKRVLTGFVFMIMMVVGLNGQGRRGNMDGANMNREITVTGKVFNDETKEPVEYANVMLVSKRDSTRIFGNVTNEDGIFLIEKVRPGMYRLDVQFMGYAKKRIDRIGIRPAEKVFDVGEIYLTPELINMDEVLVEADRVSVAFQIDKKVVHVGSQAVAASGTAVDVLENVPSVTVDIEGNVALRGSENFTVLIDGKPTILEPNEILQQLPASKIQDIEIITNPSAKFDPDGVAGILNVKMKKNKLEGISGIFSADAGLNNKYGIDGLLSYRNHKYAAFVSADFSHREFTGERNTERRFTDMDGNYNTTIGSGDMTFSREPYSIRGGLDLFITDKDVVSIGGTFGNRSHNRDMEMIYEEFNSLDQIRTKYLSVDESERSGDYYRWSLDYQHKFNEDGHQLQAQANYSTRDGGEKSINFRKDMAGNIYDGQKSTETGPSRDYRFKLDYTWPINKTDKFEAGVQSRVDQSDEGNEVFTYNTVTETYEFQDQFSHTTEYSKDIHSLYSMYSMERGRLGIQGGLRGEYVDRLVELTGENENYAVNRIDFFPSAHISWQQSEKTQFMGSYTRAIERPRGYWLEPFITWRDATPSEKEIRTLNRNTLTPTNCLF